MVRGTSINGGTLEASAYEVPVSTMHPTQNTREHESLEATYALPDAYYEYATEGPNEAQVYQYTSLIHECTFNCKHTCTWLNLTILA